MKKHYCCSWFLLLMFLSATTLAANPGRKSVETLTIEQAVQLALLHNPRLRGAVVEIDQAEAKRKQARAQFGPKLQFEMRALRFDEPPSIGGGGVN